MTGALRRGPHAEVNGTRLAYSDTGDGVPLLCLHGGMGIDAVTLRVPGILDLAGRAVRTIIPDQRGHGDSARGAAPEYTHATWAADAHALLGHLGLGRSALLGHSYGGFIALECAVRWPEAVSHLVLVGTSAGPVRAPATTFRTNGDLREHVRGQWPGFFVGDEKHWDLFGALRFSAAPYNAAFNRELPKYNLRDRVVGLDVPMLLVVGSLDPYRAHMEWIAEHAPRATLREMKGVGHFPFVEGSAEFLDAVASFLAREG